MIDSGIHVVIAAGNKDWNVENTTPARVPLAITVGASGIRDYRTKSSNWGTGIDIFAPGADITSAGIESTTVR
jgi:cerevisin